MKRSYLLIGLFILIAIALGIVTGYVFTHGLLPGLDAAVISSIILAFIGLTYVVWVSVESSSVEHRVCYFCPGIAQYSISVVIAAIGTFIAGVSLLTMPISASTFVTIVVGVWGGFTAALILLVAALAICTIRERRTQA